MLTPRGNLQKCSPLLGTRFIPVSHGKKGILYSLKSI